MIFKQCFALVSCVCISTSALHAEPLERIVVERGYFKFLSELNPQVLAAPESNSQKSVFNPELDVVTITSSRRCRFRWFRANRTCPDEDLESSDSSTLAQDEIQLKPPFYFWGGGQALEYIDKFENGKSVRKGWGELTEDEKKSKLSYVESNLIIQDSTMNFGLLKSVGGFRTMKGVYFFEYQQTRSLRVTCGDKPFEFGYQIFGIGVRAKVKSRFSSTGLSVKIDEIANAVDFNNQNLDAGIDIDIIGFKDPEFLSALKSGIEGGISHDSIKRLSGFLVAASAKLGDASNWGDPVFLGLVDNKRPGGCRDEILTADNRSKK